MKLGCLVSFNHLTPPDLIAQTAIAAEERGFDSLWVPEHVLFFPEYASRYPYSDDGRLAGDPIGVMEPFVALTYVAALTKRIRLGTGICLVPQRSPVYTAKQVADLDYLSGGRVDFGVGIGWLKEEFDALDIPFSERAPRIEECLAMMRSLWCDEVSSYQGKYYTLPPSYQNPKPVQAPHPPVFFGGESDAALSRVARIGQGWYGFKLTPETLTERLVLLDRLLAENGRTRKDIQLYVSPHGSAVNADDFARFRDMGVEQVLLPVFGRTIDKFHERADRVLALRPA
jgi:probable F420-dependent oxidoreductase